MILLEIPPNLNCEAVDQRIFNNLEPPVPVLQVRLEREIQHPRWYAVTGWTLDNQPCPATVCRVEDSGEGTVLLIAGGDAGLRLQPADRPSPWRLEELNQWGESFLLIADSGDVQLSPGA